MRIKFTQITKAAGSAAGLTFASNRGGQYARARVSPINPNTLLQQQRRLSLAAAATAWAALTEGQRAAWGTYANTLERNNSVGEPSKPSGFNAFVATNSLRLLLAQSMITTAPGTSGRATFYPPTFVQYDLAETELTVDSTTGNSWTTTAGGAFMLFLSEPISAGVSYFKGPYKLWVSMIRAGSPPADPLVFDSPPIPGTPIVLGQNRRVRIITMDSTGRLSTDWRGVLAITNGG